MKSALRKLGLLAAPAVLAAGMLGSSMAEANGSLSTSKPCYKLEYCPT